LSIPHEICENGRLKRNFRRELSLFQEGGVATLCRNNPIG